MMFPLHQGKKLVFQTSSNPPQKHTISEDRILGHAISTGKSRRRKLVAAFNYDMIDQNSNDHNKKKKMMMHRENERQRRQEMGTLHASLRSLLPLEFIKVKHPAISCINDLCVRELHVSRSFRTNMIFFFFSEFILCKNCFNFLHPTSRFRTIK